MTRTIIGLTLLTSWPNSRLPVPLLPKSGKLRSKQKTENLRKFGIDKKA